MCIGPFNRNRNKVKQTPDPTGVSSQPPTTAASAGTASTAGPNQSATNK